MRPELGSLVSLGAVTAVAPRIDLSSRISQALHETGDDAVEVHVGIK
ncbi:hypothetical protein [Nocardia sp. NPDC049707]